MLLNWRNTEPESVPPYMAAEPVVSVSTSFALTPAKQADWIEKGERVLAWGVKKGLITATMQRQIRSSLREDGRYVNPAVLRKMQQTGVGRLRDEVWGMCSVAHQGYEMELGEVNRDRLVSVTGNLRQRLRRAGVRVFGMVELAVYGNVGAAESDGRRRNSGLPVEKLLVVPHFHGLVDCDTAKELRGVGSRLKKLSVGGDTVRIDKGVNWEGAVNYCHFPPEDAYYHGISGGKQRSVARELTREQRLALLVGLQGLDASDLAIDYW